MRRVYAREEVCISCRLCEIGCAVAHSESQHIITALRYEDPKPISRIRVQVDGPISFALQCRHCAEPRCVYACLTGAMTRNPESGVVTADADKCIGCGTCMLACPYGVLTRDTEHSVVIKCDLCPGKDTPICVANCPNEALSVMD